VSNKNIDEDRLNLEIRKFLKQVGVTSQREIEKALRDALDSGTLPESGTFDARMTLSVPALGIEHVIDREINVS
jgi:hypothetical protein